MANWNNPTLLSTYSDVLTDLKARDVDAITLQYSAPSNLPTGAIKYERTANKFQEWNGSAFVDKVLSIEAGGTGAATASAARTALGLGTMSLQNSNAVAITGGSISGLSSLGVSGNITSTGNGSFSGTGSFGGALSAIAGGTVPVKSENATITGVWTFTGNRVLVTGTNPNLAFTETDQGTDLKSWSIQANGQNLAFYTLSDALAGILELFNVTRAGVVQFLNGCKIVGPISLGATAAPGQISYESGDTTLRHYIGDNTGYKWSISKRSGSVTTDLFKVSETGTTVAITGTVSISGQLTTGIGSTFDPGIKVGSSGNIGIYSNSSTTVYFGADLSTSDRASIDLVSGASGSFILTIAGATALSYTASVFTITGDGGITGHFYPTSDNTKTCGKSGNRWSAVWAANGTIQTSDERSKDIKSTFRYGLDFIRSLNPIEYDWIATPTGKTKLGFGARAIHQMYPELAMVSIGGVGNDSESVFGLNYSELIAPLVQAIKDLADRMDKYDHVQARS